MSIKRYNKNLIKIVFGIFLVILIILIVLYFSNPIVIARMKIKSMNSSKFKGDIKIPEYINFVIESSQNGILPESIIKYYNNFAENLIPKYYKKCIEMSVYEIDNYFYSNQNLIDTELGIKEKEEFFKFVSTLKNIKNDKFVLEKYYIMDSTLENKNYKKSVYLGIKYEECDDIYFRTTIEKRYYKNKTLISFDANTDLDKIENGMKKLKEREEEIKNTESPFSRGTPIE
jgi:hypothetical protein